MEPPRDLTIPEPGSTTARTVLSESLRRLLADFRGLPEAHAVSPSTRAAYRAFRRTIAELGKESPGAVASLLRRPTVAVYVRCLRDRAPGDATEPLVRKLVATALLDLAWSSALASPVRFEAPPERAICLPGRFVLDLRGARTVTFAAGEAIVDGARVALRDADHPRIARAFHPVADDAVLALADDNPLAMEEAHPDKRGNGIDLGGEPPGAWVTALRASLEPVATFMPDLRAEIALYLQQVVPVGYDARTHFSASYRESIGTIYLTLHPQPMTMTEAVIHEVSHNKLNALLELDPLLENAFEPLYTSPVRPDPRPLHGILLAVHAFLPVARLYERMRAAAHPGTGDPGFERRLREVVAKNREGAEVLFAHARPTAIGRGILDEFAHILHEFD